MPNDKNEHHVDTEADSLLAAAAVSHSNKTRSIWNAGKSTGTGNRRKHRVVSPNLVRVCAAVVVISITGFLCSASIAGLISRRISHEVVASVSDDWLQNLEACVDYDDDDQFPSLHAHRHCLLYDRNFCTGDSLSTDDRILSAFNSGSVANKFCEVACNDSESSGMVCVWNAIRNLDDVCENTFVYNASVVLPSDNSPNLPHTDPYANSTLWDCDEHAVCRGCRDDVSGTCSMILQHYHGMSWDQTSTRKSTGIAIEVLNVDLQYWCTRLGLE